ncbi:hypothetical protein MTO96_029579 [Rhipicephalus appendiculatus]
MPAYTIGAPPDACRASRTALIPKKGDIQASSNWRPIALGSTVSKLYAKCLAARLQDWILLFSILSHCQNGFLPYDGVIELKAQTTRTLPEREQERVGARTSGATREEWRFPATHYARRRAPARAHSKKAGVDR